MTGARGQKCLISGYHMVFTWYSELGLAMEKQSTTTSDLKGGEEGEAERVERGFNNKITHSQESPDHSRAASCETRHTVHVVPWLRYGSLFL